MKVSEKSLELNVGAELLAHLRGQLNMPKAYLCGLTQKQERCFGVDFFVKPPKDIRIFAFQFKAPIEGDDIPPYRFTLNREQHKSLYSLADLFPQAVHYVLPFYIMTDKLIRDVPNLAQDTWLLPVAPMTVPNVFSNQKTKRIRCCRGTAYVNPEYEMKLLSDTELSWENGIELRFFAEWHTELRQYTREQYDQNSRRTPHAVRGMRIVFVEKQDN